MSAQAPLHSLIELLYGAVLAGDLGICGSLRPGGPGQRRRKTEQPLRSAGVNGRGTSRDRLIPRQTGDCTALSTDRKARKGPDRLCWQLHDTGPLPIDRGRSRHKSKPAVSDGCHHVPRRSSDRDRCPAHFLAHKTFSQERRYIRWIYLWRDGRQCAGQATTTPPMKCGRVQLV